MQSQTASTGIEFHIRFYNKQIYFTDSPIHIKAEIVNNTLIPYRFKIADNKVFNLDFDVRSLTNIRLNHSDTFIRERNKNQAIYYREVSIEPGESHSFYTDLASFIEFKSAGVYLIQAVFYPELPDGQMNNTLISTNTLTLSIRPKAGMSAIEAQIDDETGEILQRNALAPDKVVDYILGARQKGEWDKFFLYLDVKALLLGDPVKARQYSSYSGERQRMMLEQYKLLLMQERTENEILLVPTTYVVLKTSYTRHEGTVKVLEKFEYIDFTELKEYIYYLHKIDDVWMIYDYEVINIGTE